MEELKKRILRKLFIWWVNKNEGRELRGRNDLNIWNVLDKI